MLVPQPQDDELARLYLRGDTLAEIGAALGRPAAWAAGRLNRLRTAGIVDARLRQVTPGSGRRGLPERQVGAGNWRPGELRYLPSWSTCCAIWAEQRYGGRRP